MNGDALAEALDSPENNLVGLINDKCPAPETARLSREHGGVIRSPLPGDEDRDASFSVYPTADGRLLWKRWGRDKGGNAYHLLLELGYPPREAAAELKRRAGLEGGLTRPTPLRPPAWPAPSLLERVRAQAATFRPVANLAALERAQGTLALAWPVEAVAARGFTQEFARRYGLGVRSGALLVPVTGPSGEVLALKLRHPDPLEPGRPRYTYLPSGHGTPALCSPGYGCAATVLVCEGELNGLIAHAALELAGLGVDVQGVAGAEANPHPDALAGRNVLLYADGDGPGRAALERWGRLALEAGARSARALGALEYPLDFCDLAGSKGLETLGGRLVEGIRAVSALGSRRAAYGRLGRY